ncbi:MAG: MFS transporter [Acidobacteriota bacterium]|nr:MAG: MFS transporter [Acidobacteriota bacterium]
MSKPAASQPVVEETDQTRKHPLGRVFHAFTYRDFRLIWFGAFTSSSGTWLQETALAWLLLQLTNDPFYLGLNSFLAMAPILLFTLVGGVLADRFDRRRILLTSQWSQLTFALTLATLAFMNVSGPLLVTCALMLSFLTGCAQAFGGPAYQSLIPMLVEKRDLPNAIALNSIQFQLARVVGAGIGSFPFAIFADQMIAAAVSFGFNGLTFIAVIFALMSLNLSHIPRVSTGDMRSQLREGLNFVWHQEGLRSLTFLAFACTFFGMQVTTFLAVFARDIFKTGAQGNVELMAISGAGAVVGALIVAGIGHIRHKGRYALIMQIGFGLSVVAFTLAPNIWLAYPLIFIASIFMMCVFSLITSLVQLLVSDEMRGRVMSIFMVAFRGGMPLGSLVTGALAKEFPLTSVLLVEGLIMSLLAVGYLLSNSEVKRH